MARKIKFASVERVPMDTIGSQVPGASKAVYTFRRTLKFPEGPVEQIHNLPLAAIGDAMSTFGFTAEEALEYHLMVSEAALFPDEGATTLRKSPTTVLSDPDTELLDLLKASEDAVRDAINQAQPTARASALADSAPAVTETEIADLVFDAVNPGSGNVSGLRSAGVSEYAQKRSELKASRAAVLQPNYVVDKESPAWASAMKMLSQDMAEVEMSRRAISDYRFAHFIKEGANRVIPPAPRGPMPSPEPKPDLSRMKTTEGRTGAAHPAKPAAQNVPLADPSEGAEA